LAFQNLSFFLNAYVKEPRMTRAIRPPPGLSAIATWQCQPRNVVPPTRFVKYN